MKGKISLWTGILSGISMLVIILDTKTALAGARDGIDLCISSVIPALFPFFVLSSITNTALTGIPLPFLRPIGKLCGVPKGAESLLFLGLFGGYPVGAKAVAEAYHNKAINKSVARRLLGICNNAGPSFIFGILSSLFSSLKTVFFIWLIHILSALITGFLLPGKANISCSGLKTKDTDISQALKYSIHILASVCGWIILFRILIAFFQKWFLWLLPSGSQCILIGMLELTNGCCHLGTVSEESTRFVLSCCMLASGGICVLSQTISVTRQLGLGMYITGKSLQTAISLLLASIAQFWLYPWNTTVSFLFPVISILFIIVVLLFIHNKKVVAL